jgi:cytochrome c biogenesis protein CcmG, thiol:disulfide interchange protein DsbE
MGSMRARALIFAGAVVLVVAGIVALATVLGGGSDKGDSKGGQPAADPAFASAPAPIRALHADRSRLLEGGVSGFESRIASLKGHPVVVNKWASWCGPCRAEFPVLQATSTKFGKQVAFVGLDSGDNDADATKFLKQFPLPYPSYVDRHSRIAQHLEIATSYPTTMFYDASGKMRYAHQGPYPTEAALAADIQRYAVHPS